MHPDVKEEIPDIADMIPNTTLTCERQLLAPEERIDTLDLVAHPQQTIEADFIHNQTVMESENIPHRQRRRRIFVEENISKISSPEL